MTEKGCRLVEVDDFETVRGSVWTDWWKDENNTLSLQAIETAKKGEQARFAAFGKHVQRHAQVVGHRGHADF